MPPLESGNSFIDGLFNLCVDLLDWTAFQFGISYNEINIYIFCIIWPLLTLFLIGLCVFQRREIKKLRRIVSGEG